MKNAKRLQELAPHIIPREEPSEGFTSIIPAETLNRLHLLEPESEEVGRYKGLGEFLKETKLPLAGTTAAGPLFNGTIYFVQVTFNTPNGAKSIPTADMQTAINYADLACVPISEYASQYGPNGVGISPNIIQYAVTLQGTTYNDQTLQGWINALANQNALPSSSCVVILNPQSQGVTNTNASGGVLGYHGKANVPYIFANVYGQNLTIADERNLYALVLSHEIAEMVVDPNVDGRNPEVCDGCGPNCQAVYLDFFDSNNLYISTTQSFPPSFAYAYFINGVVKPDYATLCPPPSSACTYAPPPYTGWASLGGILVSNVAIQNNLDGRLEVFAVGTDNALWHIWQTAPSNGWANGWASRGGVILGKPSVGRNADGRLEVFARGTNNALWHIWQTAPNNGWANGWASRGGVLTSDPVVCRNADGRLEVFARGLDNALWHIWQTSPNNGWANGWASLGGIIMGEPAVTNNADGRLEVFAVGTDNALWHIWQTSPNDGWSGWASRGGILTSTPTVTKNADGRLEVFARGTNNALWHIWQTSPNNGWANAWASLGGIIMGQPSVGRNADGRLEVFARGTDNALWHIWQTAPNNGWANGWHSRLGVLTDDPVVASNSDGRLEVFAKGPNNALWHIWQTAPSNGWTN